jgi:hypothetical protein
MLTKSAGSTALSRVLTSEGPNTKSIWDKLPKIDLTFSGLDPLRKAQLLHGAGSVAGGAALGGGTAALFSDDPSAPVEGALRGGMYGAVLPVVRHSLGQTQLNQLTRSQREAVMRNLNAKAVPVLENGKSELLAHGAASGVIPGFLGGAATAASSTEKDKMKNKESRSKMSSYRFGKIAALHKLGLDDEPSWMQRYFWGAPLTGAWEAPEGKGVEGFGRGLLEDFKYTLPATIGGNLAGTALGHVAGRAAGIQNPEAQREIGALLGHLTGRTIGGRHAVNKTYEKVKEPGY